MFSLGPKQKLTAVAARIGVVSSELTEIETPGRHRRFACFAWVGRPTSKAREKRPGDEVAPESENPLFLIQEMEYLQTLHSCSLQEAFSSIDSKYDIPDDVDENVLRTLRKDTEMQTFKTKVSKQHERSDCIIILCLGTFTGKETVFIKDSFIHTPPKGSSLPPPCVDIHLKRIKSSQQEVNVLSVLDENDSNPEGYAGFTLKFFHGTLVFWVPRHPSSLRQAIKWKETVVHLAHLQILCVLVAFNPTSFKNGWEEKR